jgi:thioredoxin reductase (NADPH)
LVNASPVLYFVTGLLQNFPGFPDGIRGLELTERLAEQSKKFGTEIIPKTISKLDLSSRPFKLWSEGEEDSSPLLARSIIVATGASSKRLDVPGAAEYWQKGISTCAVCDGALPIFRKQVLVVVGGGDTACEEAMYLSKTASKVLIVHRRGELRASKIMAERTLARPNIQPIWNSVVVEVKGNGRLLSSVILQNVESGDTLEVEARGLFLAIGHKPATDFLSGQLRLDTEGYIVATPQMWTSVEGVFAAGDAQDKRYRQAITAAGTGCVAALEVERWLAAQGTH